MNGQACLRPAKFWLLLVAAGVAAGLLVGGSVSLGLCSLVYLLRHSG
jgi:hypothetical protein